MFKNYYEILCVNENSSIDEIKRSYRKLSIKYHPDKDKTNNDDQYFKKITQAYEYIINNHNYQINENENKTHKNTNNNQIINYDFNNNNNNLNNNNNNLNNNNNNNNNNLNNYFNNNNNFSQNKENILIDLNISYYQSYYGTSIPINIERKNIVNNIIRSENETIYIQIPKGIDNNEIITIENKGNNYNNNFSDIKITIKLLPEKNFTRNGLDIIYIKNLSFKESLTGFSFEIQHFNQKIYKINNKNEIFINNMEKQFKNLGFQREEFTGNLIIKFHVDTPQNLNIETINKLKEIL
tara:strand:+ start:952 stop:1839 length:888 start_codon:yes stop_codon:yes gene_type:complete